MRCMLATQVQPQLNDTILVTLPWWLSQVDRGITPWIEAACELLGVKGPKCGGTESLSLSIATLDPKITHSSIWLIDRLWRVLVWPQKLAWKLGSIAPSIETSHLSDGPPVKMVGYMEGNSLDDPLAMMIKLADVSLAGGWRDSAVEGSPENMLFVELLTLHTTDQLAKQDKSWGIMPFIGDKKSKIIDFFTTDPSMAPREVIEMYGGRWNIETTFQELRAHLGLETTRQ